MRAPVFIFIIYGPVGEVLVKTPKRTLVSLYGNPFHPPCPYAPPLLCVISVTEWR